MLVNTQSQVGCAVPLGVWGRQLRSRSGKYLDRLDDGVKHGVTATSAIDSEIFETLFRVRVLGTSFWLPHKRRVLIGEAAQFHLKHS